MKLRGAASKLRRGTLKLRGRGTWLGAGAVALAVPAMFFSRRFARLLFEHHDDALIALQWMPGVGALLGSLASRRKFGPPPPLYESESMRVVRDAVAKVAPTGATVVLRGETGVGKELVARDVHDSSLRRTRPFVKINCAALPSELLEAELFGYERGAFTGAEARKRGRFEHADGGTLLLDEVGELPPELQPKLLHVLQDGEFFRIGGAQAHPLRRPRDRRHQPRSGISGRGGRVPPGPLLPTERRRDPYPAPARAAGAHSRARRVLPASLRGRVRPGGGRERGDPRALPRLRLAGQRAGAREHDAANRRARQRRSRRRRAPVPREGARRARRCHVRPRHRRRGARAQGDLAGGRTRSRARRAARRPRARRLESPARRPDPGHQLSLAPLQARGPSAAAAGSRRGRRLRRLRVV